MRYSVYRTFCQGVLSEESTPCDIPHASIGYTIVGMFRVFIFGFAVLVVFTGMVKVLPILEGTPGERQMAAVVQAQNITPECTISAESPSITAGEEVSVAWVSRKAATALLFGVGAVPVEGGMFVAPLESTTLALVVYSMTGQVATCTTEIVVNPAL